MREWNLKGKIPLSFFLTPNPGICRSNQRFCHSWELSIGDSSRPYIGIYSTLGLKVIDLGLSLAFSQENWWVFNPDHFYSGPVIKGFSLNYIRMQVVPFKGLDTSIEFFVSDPDIVCGRITIKNINEETCSISAGVFGNLVTDSLGNPFSIKNQGIMNYLLGSNGDCVFPTLLMNGGPSSVISPITGLSLPMRILPGDVRTINWSCSVAETPDLSLELGRSALKRDWEKDISRMEHNHDATILDVNCGNAEWDAIFATSQIFGQQLLMMGNEKKTTGFFQHRNPDTAYPTPDEKKFANPSLFLLNHLKNTLLPGNPQPIIDIMIQLLKKMRLDMGGSNHTQRSLSLPFLAQIVVDMASYEPDLKSDEKVLATLTAYVDAWFDEVNDRDHDCLPEMSDPSQSHLFYPSATNAPNYSASNTGLHAVESPALAFLLIRELESITEIADAFSNAEVSMQSRKLILKLTNELNSMYQRKQSCFAYRDRDTHCTQSAKQLMKFSENSNQNLKIQLDSPQRLTVNFVRPGLGVSHAKVKISGLNTLGNQINEVFNSSQNKPFLFSRVNVSERIFSYITSIEIDSLEPDSSCEIGTFATDNIDIRSLLPAAQQTLTVVEIKKMAKKYVDATSPEFFFGIPELLNIPIENVGAFDNVINIPWNMMIIEQLILSGLNDSAFQLIQKIMTLQTQSLSKYHTFFDFYQSASGIPIGHSHSLSGLIPIAIFLKLIGIKITSPQEVAIFGEFPLSNPVRINYRGLQIFRSKDLTRVVMPNGKVFEMSDNKLHMLRGN